MISWPFGVGVATLVSIVPKFVTAWNLASCSRRSRHSESFPYAFISPPRISCRFFHWMYSLFVSYRSSSLICSYFRSFLSFLAHIFAHSNWAKLLYILLQLRRPLSRFQWLLWYLRILLPDTSIFPTVGPGTSNKCLSYRVLMLLRGSQRSGIGILYFITHHTFPFSLFLSCRS